MTRRIRPLLQQGPARWLALGLVAALGLAGASRPGRVEAENRQHEQDHALLLANGVETSPPMSQNVPVTPALEPAATLASALLNPTALARAVPPAAASVAALLPPARKATPAVASPTAPAHPAKRISRRSVAPAAAPAYQIVWMEVTAYCPCKKCCGRRASGKTASGKTVEYNSGRFVAADTDLLQFGTRVQIPGYHGGRIVEVIDRGGDIKGRRLDVFFPTHAQAEEWGRQWIAVKVWR